MDTDHLIESLSNINIQDLDNEIYLIIQNDIDKLLHLFRTNENLNTRIDKEIENNIPLRNILQ